METKRVTAATLKQRGTHFFIDTWTITAIWFVLGFVAILIAGWLHEGEVKSSGVYDLMLSIALATSYSGYYIISEHFFQKTLAKKITGNLVIGKYGNRPGLGKVVLRTLFRLIPVDHLSFLLLPFGLHDLLSSTRVIQENEKTLHNTTNTN
jgi:hypothetical protein